MEDMPFEFNVKSTIKMLVLVTDCESILERGRYIYQGIFVVRKNEFKPFLIE